MLPDCECKGRAFLHSLQEITEKKCEKISFAPILSPHSIAKSAIKPIFSPLPHPSFFTPKSPFFPLFSVSNPISGDFSRDRARFLPCEAHFFSSFLVLEPTADVFSMAHPRFFPFYRLFLFPFSHFESNFRRFFDGTSLFSAPKLTFSLLFPVLPHASGTSSRDLTHYFLRTPFFTQRECFSDSCFPHSSRPAPPSSPDLLPFRPSFTPPSSLPPPISFSFLPTFPSPSPINARTRAPSRTTCVRVRLHIPTRQEVFVYCLHRFTHLPQSAVHQHIRREEKQEKTFIKNTTISKSTYYHKRQISSTVNSICRRGEPHLPPP